MGYSLGYVTRKEVECNSCGRTIHKNELQYDSPEGRICPDCYKGKQPRQLTPLKETHPFLLEDEEVVRELESGWNAVRHGRKFEWSKSMFRFGLLRKPLLTNKRLVLLKGEEIDYELPIEDIKSVEIDSVGTGNPYLKMELKNGEGVSLAFVCPSVKMFLGALYLLGKQRSVVNQWVQSINNLVLMKKME
jgi:hypothetical protein